MGKYNSALLIFNENSGQSDINYQMDLILSHFNLHRIPLKVENLPDSSEQLDALISEAIANGTDLFIAAGGDGTAALVGSPLVGTGKPMGILPIGTGNFLAKELGIPLNLINALNLITTNDADLFQLDTIEFLNRHYIRNISMGVVSKVINDTPSEEKKRLGFFAYVIHFFQQILGLELDRYYLEYDHKIKTVVASEILITNARLMGIEPLEWSEDILINDGVMEIFVIRAANLLDVIRFLFSAATKRSLKTPIIKSMKFNQYCRIETQTPVMVQADGDLIGKSPIEAHIRHQSLTIIVPDKDAIGILREKRNKRKE